LYQEKEKNIVREKVLQSAVSDLTTDREESYILKTREIEELYKYIFEQLAEYNHIDKRDLCDKLTFAPLYDFLNSFNDNKQTKLPSNLKVLYLCGPKPSNDIDVLLQLGITQQNIWAIESDLRTYEEALIDIKSNNYNINIYKGSLVEFLSINNEIFDIIYYDSCSEFATDSLESVKPVIEVLLKNRISSLSVLITNFSEIKMKSYEKSAAIASYYSGRYNDYPEKSDALNIDPAIMVHENDALISIIDKNTEIFYSDYITRLIIDLSRFLIPNSRAVSYSMFQKMIFNRSEISKIKSKSYKDSTEKFNNKKIDWEKFYSEVEEWDLNPNSYPLYTFLNKLPKLTKSTSFSDNLKSIKFNGHNVKDLMPIATLFNDIFDGHWNLVEREHLINFVDIWFDDDGGIFCDIPLPNLLVNSHMGKLGHPFFPNTSKIQRFSYTAKKTQMFTDYFILDDCSEFFKWFPSLGLTRDFFKEDIRQQILARAIIDRLGRMDLFSDSNPYRGSSLVCLGETDLGKNYPIPKRMEILA